jgi:hypothetical protein
MLLILLSVATILVGCQQEWHFKVTNLRDPNNPHFCISRSMTFECVDAYGVSFSRLGIWESNKKGDYVKQVWGLEADEGGDSKISALIYGVAPEGYQETMKARPIELGKIYIMDNLRYFRLIKSGNTIEAEIYSHKEFVDKFE